MWIPTGRMDTYIHTRDAKLPDGCHDRCPPVILLSHMYVHSPCTHVNPIKRPHTLSPAHLCIVPTPPSPTRSLHPSSLSRKFIPAIGHPREAQTSPLSNPITVPRRARAPSRHRLATARRRVGFCVLAFACRATVLTWGLEVGRAWVSRAGVYVHRVDYVCRRWRYVWRWGGFVCRCVWWVGR